MVTSMYKAIYIISTISFLITAFLELRYFTHMFQLNSYKPKVQIKWLLRQKGKLFFSLLCIIAAVLAGIGYVAEFVVSVFCLYAAYIYKPAKAKKPLVYTARVKRLLTTAAVIYIIIEVLSVTLGGYAAGAAAYFTLLAIAPIVLLAANLINRPVEKAINRHYIKDAEKILASMPELTVIGITGSYGKTSLKYFLTSLLKAKYNVLMTPESFNTPMGIVKTIRGELSAVHNIFVCEMGAKNVGDIKEICDIVHPRHGIITSVGPQHLESFKTLDNVKKTKFELADALAKDGMLFLNCDDENIRSVEKKRPFISYGIDCKDGYHVTALSVSEKGSEFTVVSPSGESGTFRTSLVGRHNVLNIVGAIAVSHQLGISFDELKPQVMRLKSVPHRLELIDKGGVLIIDDAYNSNPSGTKAALEVLSMLSGEKILLTPGMIELGSKQEELNRQFGADAAKVCDRVILVGEKQTKPIYDGLLSAGFSEEKIFVAKDLNEALDFAYAVKSGKKKIILLENDLPDNY